MATFDATAQLGLYTCARCSLEKYADSFPRNARLHGDKKICLDCRRATANLVAGGRPAAAFDFEAYRLKVVIRSQNARAKARGLSGTITVDDFNQICERQEWLCAICGVDLKQVLPSVDHKIGLRNGGAHDVSNIQATCKSCNCRKQ